MDIRGVLLDTSVLDESASVEKLLFRLGYSNLHVVRKLPSLALLPVSVFPLETCFLWCFLGNVVRLLISTRNYYHFVTIYDPIEFTFSDGWPRSLPYIEQAEELSIAGLDLSTPCPALRLLFWTTSDDCAKKFLCFFYILFIGFLSITERFQRLGRVD